jgi:Bacterial PH domain
LGFDPKTALPYFLSSEYPDVTDYGARKVNLVAQVRICVARRLEPRKRVSMLMQPMGALMAADYFPLLSRAIQGLAPNALEQRQAVYDRARQLVEGNLRTRTPPVSADEIVAERQALEEAIWRIEMDSAVKTSSHDVAAVPIRINAAPSGGSAIDFGSLKYTRKILQPGEKVLAQGRYHWIIYVPPILFFLLGLWAFSSISKASADSKTVLALVAPCLILFGAGTALRAWFRQWTTEIAITNLRIVRKGGFIRRRTWEMNMDKVESVTVDQGILGRILNYGTIHVLGTGEGMEHLHQIRSPIEIRNRIVAR